MIIHRWHYALLFWAFTFLLLWPNCSIADVSFVNQTITKSSEWAAKTAPYLVSGVITIPKGVALTINAGTVVRMIGGQFKVLGSLIINGSSTSPVLIYQDSGSTGFSLQEGMIEARHVNIFGGSKVIDAYNGSRVEISDSSLDGSSGYTSVPAISIWDSSNLFLLDSELRDIRAQNGIEVFDRGSINISNVSFKRVGRTASVVIYDSSGGQIEGSSFSDAVVGVQAFNGAVVVVHGSQFKGNSESGLLIHNNANVSILDSDISENDIGIESYNASTSIAYSSVENNKQYGVFVSGGTFKATDNWWGNESGPRHSELNILGRGNEVEGSIDILPWLTEKPKKQVPCCSNVLFIPGLQGSRLYRKQLFTENQLWEPNRNADVKKLYLNNSGVPIDNTIYTRDAIMRTNIGFGILDRDIYKGLADSLDMRVKNHSMNSWQTYAYDWRSSPGDIVKDGTKISKGTERLEDLVKMLAASSANKKVTIIAHSYGGLMAKALTEQLEKNGRSNLVDKVILVSVPEDGSIMAAAGLLHGDEQELGRGFILSADVARGWGVNMPAAYYLLPDQALLSWLSSPAIHIDQGVLSGPKDISDASSFDNFLKNTGNQRPFSHNTNDLQLPANLNAALLDRARAAETLAKKTSDIPFVNIIGSGLKTIRSIHYKNIECNDTNSTAAFLGSISCGLNHQLLFTDSGDGTVLTGNLNDRWGDKLIFDIGAYNAAAHTNYSHTDILSSPPIIDTINGILSGNPDIVWSGYIKSATSTYDSNEIHRPAYQVSVKGRVLMSATSDEGRVTGLQAKDINEYSFPVFSQIPNSSYINTSGGAYILTEEIPKKLSIQSGGGEVGMISVEAESVGQLSGLPAFSFTDIPVTADTRIEVDGIKEGASSSATMHIDRDGDGTFENTIIYSPEKAVSSVTPAEALQKLRSVIASSTVSLRFKQRYTTRTNPVASYIKNNQNTSALSYSSQTVGSLAAIVKELSRATARYYKGGMTKTEASFMYFSWADFANTMKEIANFKPV